MTRNPALAAAIARERAQADLRAAQERCDTQAISRARKELAQATHAALAAEIAHKGNARRALPGPSFVLPIRRLPLSRRTPTPGPSGRGAFQEAAE